MSRTGPKVLTGTRGLARTALSCLLIALALAGAPLAQSLRVCHIQPTDSGSTVQTRLLLPGESVALPAADFTDTEKPAPAVKILRALTGDWERGAGVEIPASNADLAEATALAFLDAVAPRAVTVLPVSFYEPDPPSAVSRGPPQA